MGAGIALVVGVAAALNGLSWLWIGLMAAGLNIGIKMRTESSFRYMLGFSVFLIVGFCRALLSGQGEAAIGADELPAEIQGSVSRVQEKSSSTWIYVKTKENVKVLVVSVHGAEIEEDYYKGQVLKISGEAEAFTHPGNPGQFDEKNYYRAQGIAYRIWAKKIVCVYEGGRLWRGLRILERLKGRMVAFYQKTMGETGAGVVSAAVLGERSGFQEDLRRYYQENGWMHLVTTSGLHLSFIAMGLYRKLRKSTVSVVPSTAAALAAMMAYGYMTDFGDSMLRAMGMMMFLLAAKLAGRKTDVPTALVLTADVMLMIRPERLMSPGFQLSFGAVAGVELGKYFVKCFSGKRLNKFEKTFFVQSGIFLVTLPVLLWHMYEVPLLGFFYNFFMIPLISVVVPLAFLAGLFGSGEVPVMAAAAAKVMRGIDWTLNRVHRLPSVALFCGRPQWWQIGLFCFCVWAAVSLILRRHIFWKADEQKQSLWTKFRAILPAAGILAAGCLILMGVRERSDRIVCMDVGQGDGLCIFGENGQVIVVDGGSSDVKKVYPYRIEPMLKYYGVRKIDAWFLTHGDDDHVSGIEEALEQQSISIGQIILPDVSGDETLDAIRELAVKEHIPVRVIRPGNRVRSGNFNLVCLYPEAGEHLKDKNNHSLVLSLTRIAEGTDFTMLFMGDLEKQGEKQLLEKTGVPDCDVLKVAHHGSSGATSGDFLKSAKPEWAFISCGKDNRYGHPHAETLERLAKADCRYLTTAKQGALILRFSSEGYQVFTWYDILNME